MKSPLLYRAAASVLLLRNAVGNDSVEVLMLQRPAQMSFPGAWVFPGGCLEAQDHDPAMSALAKGLSRNEANLQLQVTDHGLAWWFAAVRELFEETGVLLASQIPEHSELLAGRRDILSGTVSFSEWVSARSLSFDLSELQYQSFWIAPAWVAPRYATRFFVAAFPEAQTVLTDSDEADELRWVKPVDAINTAEELRLPRPTLENLKLLAGFRNVGAAMAALSERGKPDTPAIWPERSGDEVTLREVNQSLAGLQLQLSQS